jgi:hypothetical protein
MTRVPATPDVAVRHHGAWHAPLHGRERWIIRAVGEGDCATRTGGRSKQRPYHEGITVHGPTA